MFEGVQFPSKLRKRAGGEGLQTSDLRHVRDAPLGGFARFAPRQLLFWGRAWPVREGGAGFPAPPRSLAAPKVLVALPTPRGQNSCRDLANASPIGHDRTRRGFMAVLMPRSPARCSSAGGPRPKRS